LARVLQKDGKTRAAQDALHQAEVQGLSMETVDPLERQIFLKFRHELAQR
jgi:hypothetical protein